MNLMDSILRSKTKLNKNIQIKLENAFKPMGILSHTNCCRLGCTGSYDEYDEKFEFRKNGIVFFRIHLNGMNYCSQISDFYIMYENYEYLVENWENESDIIHKWFETVGIHDKNMYNFDIPENEKKSIHVKINGYLQLEEDD
jgi:hypothetical protein